MLILVFSVWLGWLPSGGQQTVSLNMHFDLRDRVQHMILPVLVLSFGPIAFFSRIMRTETLEVIHTDYIRTAKAKGLRYRRVVGLHVLRNSLIPAVTVAGPILGFLITGSFVIEQIFAIPGFGKMLVDGVFNRDYAVVQGVVLVSAGLYVFLNLLADILYFLANPRLRGT